MRRGSVLQLFLLACAVCTPHFLFAEDTSLGEVIVRDHSSETATSHEASDDTILPSTVITKKDLQGRRTSLPEILESSGGVSIRRLGGLDDFATVSIHGSTSEQVTVYLDDLPLNQADGRGINLAAIPTDQIERIEVYKGAAPAHLPSSAMGGVLRIVTKKSGKGGTQLVQSYGSYNTYQGSLLHQGHFRNLSYQAGYSFDRSSGDFRYRNDNGTPFNPSDDRVVPRRNNHYSRHNLLMSVGYKPDGKAWSLDVSNQFFREDRGIPGLATLTSDVAHLATTRDGISADLSLTELTPHLTLHLKPFFQFLKEQFDDPLGDIGLLTEDNDNLTLAYGLATEARYLLGARQKWTALLAYDGEQFLPTDFAQVPANSPGSLRHHLALGIEDEIFLFGDRLILNPSLRTEHFFNDFAGGGSTAHHPVSGKLGLKYRPVAGLQATTSFSRSYRVPNFSELFGDRGTLNGNPNLRPENSLNWDIGPAFDFQEAGWTGVPLSLQVSYFLNHMGDLIQFLQTSQYTVQARNLSSARLQGIEMSLSSAPLPYLECSANYTFQLATNTSGTPGIDGKTLPGRPRHEAGGQVILKNRWGRIFGNVNFIDRNYLDTQNILAVRRRLFVGAGFSFTPLKWLTTGFEAKNLLNERVSDVVGFPLPGRSYYGKVEINI